MSYNKALKKLEALPPGERQLAAGQYVWEVKNGKSHCGCAIGKLLTERQRVKLFKAKGVFGGYANKSGVGEIASFLGVEVGYDNPDEPLFAGLTFREADRLQDANDSFQRTLGFKGSNDYATRKARYKHVVAWLRGQVASLDEEITT